MAEKSVNNTEKSVDALKKSVDAPKKPVDKEKKLNLLSLQQLTSNQKCKINTEHSITILQR